MTRIYAFFITLLCMQSVAYAVDLNENCVIDSTTETEQCNSNLYCAANAPAPGTTGVCTQCPETHPYSILGQNNDITQCYNNCENKPNFGNGTWAPDAGVVYYNNVCQYTNTSNISCDNPENACDGYHLEAGTCVSNFKECSEGSGFQTYDNNTSSWTECFITQCAEGYHLENTNLMCGQSYGNCVSDTNTCESELTCDYGEITGNVQWQNNAYDYSDCKCTGPADLNYGTGTKLCTWDNNSWSNCHITLETCVSGYWQGESDNPTDCTQVTAGYFSDEGSLDRTKCPAGSTSDAESSAITNCHMTGGATQICDGNTPANCFTLPASASNIYYHGSNNSI